MSLTTRTCMDCGWAFDLGVPTKRQFCDSCKAIRSAAAKHSSAMKLKFGITDKEYLRLLEAQDGHCALCPRRPTSARRLAVDHDHATGRVRGLLCMFCNRNRLGKGREDAQMHLRIAKYLADGPRKVADILGREVIAPLTSTPRKRRTRRRTK